MIKAFLGLLGIAPELIEARTELKRAKIEAQSKAVTMAGEREGAWETLAGENARNSWIDEFWTIILSIPLVLAFIPALQPYVGSGFSALEDVPEWYRWAILAAISFAFARRKLPDLSAWKRRS